MEISGEVTINALGRSCNKACKHFNSDTCTLYNVQLFYTEGRPNRCDTCLENFKVDQAKERDELEALGFEVWHTHGKTCFAKKVDPEKFGKHEYTRYGCKYGCGCWMGATMSGGPVNPFGACPKNENS